MGAAIFYSTIHTEEKFAFAFAFIWWIKPLRPYLWAILKGIFLTNTVCPVLHYKSQLRTIHIMQLYLCSLIRISNNNSITETFQPRKPITIIYLIISLQQFPPNLQTTFTYKSKTSMSVDPSICLLIKDLLFPWPLPEKQYIVN